MISAVGDTDDVADTVRAGENEFRRVADDRDKGAFLFVADKEKENVFKDRSVQAGAPGIIVERSHRHPDPRTFTDQVLVAADGVNRSVKSIAAAAGDGIDGGAGEIALPHVEWRDVDAELIDRVEADR